MVDNSKYSSGGLWKPETSAVVTLHQTHQQALDAIGELERTGRDMRTLSIIGRDYYTEEGVVGSYTTGDRMKAWGKKGAFLDTLWDHLIGSAFFLIPGIGPVFFAGPVVGRIVEGLEASAGVAGLSALGTALYGLGVPREDIPEYEKNIRAGMFVVVMQNDEGVPAADAPISG